MCFYVAAKLLGSELETTSSSDEQHVEMLSNAVATFLLNIYILVIDSHKLLLPHFYSQTETLQIGTA